MVIEESAEQGVATNEELSREFASVYEKLNAKTGEKENSWKERLISKFNELISIKKTDEKTAEDKQKDFMKALQDEGAKVAVCYSAEEAREMIRFYLSPAEGFNLVNCEEAIRTVDGCEGYGLGFAPCDKCKNHIKR